MATLVLVIQVEGVLEDDIVVLVILARALDDIVTGLVVEELFGDKLLLLENGDRSNKIKSNNKIEISF